ncbi:MAG TPA: hypothetical protein VHX20_03790 [Terracidiphilus sp.]|jgi:hypothetical protein|nr:hypothetical protein [Terracidiphilus sp.]
MASIIPFISTTSLVRIVLSTVLLLPLTDCHATVHDEGASSASSSFSAEMPSSAYGFVNSIGLNTHLNYFDRTYGNFPLIERELKSLGVLHLRDGVHLQGSDYNALLYGRWIALGKLGIRFDAVLDPRSNVGVLNASLLEKIDALAGHTIESFEGPNELDVSNESDWPSVDRKYQSSLFDSDKALEAANSVRIIGPSLAFASDSSSLGDVANQMDFGNLHPYPAGKMPSVIFPEQVDLEKVVCDNKQIVFTESGYHNAINEHNQQPGVSETAAAKYIPRLFLEDYAHGISRTYLYELLDETPDAGMTDPQMHWGLIRVDGSEKPAFLALKNLIAELSDSSEPSRLSPLSWALKPYAKQVHHLLLEKSDGTYDLVLWQEVSSYDTQHHADIANPDVNATLTFDLQARNIIAYEPATQTNPINGWNNVKSVSLRIPDHPLVVEITF